MSKAFLKFVLAITFSSCLLITACSVSSKYGPVNSAYFDRTVEKSLASSSGGEIHESLRSNWIPHNKKDRIRGIFAITARGLVFASWDDPQGLYQAKYRVPYHRLNTIRIQQEQFQKKLRVETQSGRIDYFEILTQSPKPPFVVNNDLTEDVFELLKNVKREQTSKSRHRNTDEINFQKIQRDKPRKRRPSKKKHRKKRVIQDDDY